MAYAFSGVSKSLRHEGKTNGRRKRESSGGVDAHDLSDSHPVVSEVMERVVCANSHVAHVEASLSPDGWVGCVVHHIADNKASQKPQQSFTKAATDCLNLDYDQNRGQSVH